MYVIGARTVGRKAGVVAAALTALAPFMIFYSSEARAYQLAIVLVLLSTLALLNAVRDGRTGWWVAYAACSCAAVYTHYTSAFPLAAQLLWVLWAHPRRARPRSSPTSAHWWRSSRGWTACATTSRRPTPRSGR